MKENNNSFIIISGVIILCIFTWISTSNLIGENTKSNSYFTKTDENMTSKIKKVTVYEGNLNVITENNPLIICVKSTKSTPKDNNVCWKEIKNNNYTIKVISGKKYYIWIKDINNKISNPEIINA